MKSQGNPLPPNWKLRQANTESDSTSAQEGRKPFRGPVTEHENLHLVACQKLSVDKSKSEIPKALWRSPWQGELHLHHSNRDIMSKPKKKSHLLSTGRGHRIHF